MKVIALLKQLTLPGLVLLLATCPVATAGSLHVNGSWQYSDSDGGADQFKQNYNASYTGKADITDLTQLSGSIRYSKTIVESDTQDFVSPSLNLVNNNDIYRFSLNGNYNHYRTDFGRDRDSVNWNSRLASNWSDTLWPSLAAYYGQTYSSADNINDSESDRAGGQATWGYWQWLDLSYSVEWNENRVDRERKEDDRLRQLATININSMFWNRRGQFSASQSYQQVDQDFSAPTDESGIALIPLVVSQASYEETNDPLTGALSNNASFLLSDEQPPVTLDIDPLNDPMNLGVMVDFQQVKVIYLVTEDDISSYANNFRWDLYSSNNGIDWDLQEADLFYIYNDLEKRFEFAVEILSSRHIKLVAGTSLLLPGQVTAIEAIELFREITGDGKIVTDSTKSKDYQTQFNLGFLLARNLNFNYNFNHNRRDQDTTPLNKQTMNSGSLSWFPSSYFTARINATENRDDTDGQPEDKTRNYSLSLSSAPLTTLDVGAGATRAEHYEDDDRQSVIHNYSLYATAQLYRDLEASLDLAYRKVKEGTGDDSFGSSLYMTARLTPTLLLSLDQNYSRNLDRNTDALDNTLRLNWRTSEIMFFNSELNINWQDDADTRKRFTLGVGIAPNRKQRISMTYNYINDERDTIQNMNGNWNWIITRVFSFQLNGNYRFESGDLDSSWNFSGRLTAQYSNSR
jgi:hypothetical protein